jgi:hypothetical protein
MGSYQSTSEAINTSETPKSNVVAQSISAYKCGIEMAKQEKNSENILELVNKNIIPTDATKEEYNEVIEVLNELMLALAQNNDNNSNEVLMLDRIIRSISYDRDNGLVETEEESSVDDNQ